MHVTASTSIQSPAEVIEDVRGIQTLVVNGNHCEPGLVERLAQLLRPFTTAAAVERELRKKRYTYEQTARMLDVSVKWLQRRVAKDLIPYVTDGHRTWFEYDDILVIRQALRERQLDSLKGTGRHVERQPS